MTIPKKMYVGDTVELQYTFRSAVDFFADAADDVKTQDIDLETSGFKTDTDEYTITKLSLARNGLQYTLNMTFVPWQTGELVFPAFDMAAAVYGSSSSPFIINLQAVEVSSILQNAGEASLHASAGPLLLPGTMYALYGIAIAAVVILILLIRLIAKWQAVSAAYRMRKLRRAYVRNAKELFRELRRLEKEGVRIDDGTFCAELQQLVRKYMDFRFGYHFTTVATPAILDTFDKVMANTMSERQQTAALSMSAVLRRTDYVRFARGSADSLREPSDQYAAQFADDERNSLLRIVRDAVERFES